MKEVLNCVPPLDKPKALELSNCSKYFSAEMSLLANVQIILALGKIGFDGCLKYFRKDFDLKMKDYQDAISQSSKQIDIKRLTEVVSNDLLKEKLIIWLEENSEVKEKTTKTSNVKSILKDLKNSALSVKTEKRLLKEEKTYDASCLKRLLPHYDFYLNKQKTASGDYKQKIAVIPFTNLNKDEDGAFLVDGIVEDLITEFSMISEIEIVSRQTCFNLRDENLSHQEYREKYELDYIVSGSIRAVEDRLRISVELSETPDGNVIWSNKYDRVKEDIFDIQDEIVRKITIALLGGIEISSLKRAHRKPTESMNSYEFLLKGKENHHKFTKEANFEAIKNLDLAIAADKNNAQAYAWKACVMGQAFYRGYTPMTDEKMGELLSLLEKALEVDPNDFECHRMQAEVYLSMHDFEKSKDSGRKATAINPNDPRVISVYGEALLRLRELDQGINYLEKAYELDPVPQGQRRFSQLARIHMLPTSASFTGMV